MNTTRHLVFVGALLVVAALWSQELPRLPLAADEPSVPVLYPTTLAWDEQPEAEAFSLVLAGQTNLTTLNQLTVNTAAGTWPVELRAHRGTNSSLPVRTNLIVNTATWLRVQPAVRTNGGPLVLNAWPTGELNTASLPTNVFIGYGAVIARRFETNRSLNP